MDIIFWRYWARYNGADSRPVGSKNGEPSVTIRDESFETIFDSCEFPIKRCHDHVMYSLRASQVEPRLWTLVAQAQ